MRVLALICWIGFASYAAAETLRIHPDELRTLSWQDIVIIDARPAQEYLQNHIPGAINFPEELSYQQKTSGGLIVEPNVMQKLLRERGIDINTKVIVYDTGNLLDAARIFWVLEVYGLKNVRILSPGIEYWHKQTYPTTREIPKPNPSQYVTTINHRRIASKLTTQLASKDNSQLIIDARSSDAYNGKISTSKRFGHIPRATNIPLSNNLHNDGNISILRDIKDLQSAYALAGDYKKVVTYCDIGRASSVSYLALRELGYEVANYDASWKEWGNDVSLPIEK